MSLEVALIKMAWIEPLELETWFINVFSGSLEIFTGIALIALVGLAAYFRMTGVILIYLLGIFFLMFSGYLDASIYFLLISIGAILAGFWIKKIVSTP